VVIISICPAIKSSFVLITRLKGRVAINLDEAKAAFRAGWERGP
jgi:hypothetical protein